MRLLRLLLLLSVTLVAGLPAAGAAHGATAPATDRVAATAAAAPDCTRKRTPLPELLAAADAVVTGTVDVVFPAVRATTFEVDLTQVHKAPDPVPWRAQVAVRTPRGECKLEGVRRDAKWLFVGNVDRQDRLVVTAVGGSQRLTPALKARVDQLMAAEAPEPPAPQLELVADSEPPQFWPLAMPGLVLFGVGLLVWLLARVLGRPKER